MSCMATCMVTYHLPGRLHGHLHGHHHPPSMCGVSGLLACPGVERWTVVVGCSWLTLVVAGVQAACPNHPHPNHHTTPHHTTPHHTTPHHTPTTTPHPPSNTPQPPHPNHHPPHPIHHPPHPAPCGGLGRLLFSVTQRLRQEGASGAMPQATIKRRLLEGSPPCLAPPGSWAGLRDAG